MNRYNAQSMTQLVETLQQLTQQQTRAREQYSPSTPQAAAPQTPFQGLLSGVIGEHNRRREDVKLQEDAALKQSLAILDLIPDTPENTPKKLQLLTSILHPKTQKGWKEVWNPQADHTAQAEFLQKFTGMLPSDAGLSATEQQVRDQQITSGPGALLTQGVNQKYAEQNRGKFEFPDDGQYQGGQIIQTADGLVLVTFDRKTGEPKLKPLGQGVTEKQSVQQLKNEGRGAASDNNPTLKRAIGYAKLAALQAEDIPFSEFDKLQKTDPDKYFKYMDVGSAKAQEFLDNQNAAAGLRVPYLQAKTAEALANEKRGGVTGGQAATIQRQDQKDLLKAQQDEADATAEVQRLQTLKDNIWNNWKSKNPSITDPLKLESEMFIRKSTRQEVVEYRKITAELAAAQIKLDAAKKARGVVGKAAKKARGVVGKSVPRGAGGGGRSLTGNLDIDRIMSQAPPSTGAPGGEHYVVQDVPPDKLRVPAEFDIEAESVPEGQLGKRSLGRNKLFNNNPMVWLINPATYGTKPAIMKKFKAGDRVTFDGISYIIMKISSDGSKVLAHVVPGQE